MTEKEIKAVEALCVEINKIFLEFKDNTVSPTNKAAARRARKNSMALTNMMKEYRAISIK